MKEYIERAHLLKNLGYDETRRDDVLPGSTFDIVLKEPAADVAEVVLCKDCQYYQDAKTNKKGFLICPASGMKISETDYCSYGVRMGQEDKHEVKCAKCGEIKEIICTVDGKPWCEDCFDKAMGSGANHETN
jgi:hypothetical protein